MRDYSFEHKKRKQTRKRLNADIDIKQAEALLKRLKDKQTSYTSWLEIQINNELRTVNKNDDIKI